MNSGSSNGGFSIPLLPCRYFLLKHQWRGTGTVFLVAFRWTSSLGSWAVTSCISTTSGRATSWSTETGDIKLLIVLKVFLSNIFHLSLIDLFEFSHSQPVHPPQLLLWEFRYIWSDFLYNKKKVLHVNKEDLAHSVSLSKRMEGFKPHRCRRCLSSHPQIPFSAAWSSPASLPSRAPSPSLSSRRQSARKVSEGLHYCKIKANAIIIDLRVTEINITLSQQCSAVTLNASKILLKKMKLGS